MSDSTREMLAQTLTVASGAFVGGMFGMMFPLAAVALGPPMLVLGVILLLVGRFYER